MRCPRHNERGGATFREPAILSSDTMQIFVKDPFGRPDPVTKVGLADRVLTLTVSAQETVSALKQRLASAENIPVDKQRLIFGGRQLADSSTLASNGVMNLSTVEMVVNCFPGAATVRTRTHTHTPIRDIKIGDSVWDGTTFTDVYMLSRADGAAAANYVTIDELRITVGHLVVVGCTKTNGAIVEALVPAEEVKVGQLIRDANGWRAVTTVTGPVYARDGTFCPLTLSGKIAVNGICCSCYTTSNPPVRTVPLSVPARLLYKMSAKAAQLLSDTMWDLRTSRPKFWSRTVGDQPILGLALAF